MTKDEFSQLFESALELAARQAEEQTGQSIPRKFQILLYGADHSGDQVDLLAATDILYLGEDKFYRIIDLSVTQEFSLVFTRISSHEPGTFAQTWNNPTGYGPFKLMLASKLNLWKSKT